MYQMKQVLWIKKHLKIYIYSPLDIEEGDWKDIKKN